MSKKLIVVEGLDKCGKTTFIKTLKKELNATVISFPNQNIESGKQLRKIINGDEICSNLVDLFIKNREETHMEIIEKLKEENVILDRYVFSGIAYSDSFDYEENFIEPDEIIFMISQYKEFLEDDIFENEEYQNKVKENFMKIMTNLNKIGYKCICKEDKFKIYKKIGEKSVRKIKYSDFVK